MKSSRLRRRVVGVSQVVAVLLMIAIAVAAALVSYFWVMGYFKSTSNNISNSIQIQSVAYTGTHLVAYVQNVGKGTVHLISNQCFYVDGALRTEASENPNALQVNATASIIDNMTLSMGQKIQLKVVTTEGTFAEAYFTVTKFTGDYTLSLLIIGGGNVSEVPSGSTFYYDNVQLTASPDPHWTFSGWSGDLSGITNPTSILVDRNVAVTATFVAIQHTITFNQNGVGQDFTGTLVTIDGTGYGVADLPQIFTWNEGSQHSFSFNSPLAVGTDTQYVWASTSGLSTNQNDTQFAVPNSDGTITGNYGTQYYLAIDNGGQGTQSGQGWYNASSSAAFDISPTTIAGGTGTQYNFTGWAGSGSGSYTGTGSSQSVTMNNPINETAQWMTQYNVTFAVNPLGNGTTTPSGTGWLDAGSNVTITAYNATVSYKFTSWSTADNIAFADPYSNPTVATINGPGTVTANFANNTEQITIDSNPEGPGFVNVDGTNYATPYTFPWTAGDAHTLEAMSPVPGATGTQYNFTSWSNGGNQTHVYTVPSSSATVTADYTTQTQITFDQTGVGSDFAGTVVSIDGSNYNVSTLPISFWWDDQSAHNFAFQSPLAVGSEEQYVWTGTTGLSALQSGNITVSASGNITANYQIQCLVTFAVSPSGSGSITTPPTASAWVYAGYPITASPASGYKFAVWSTDTQLTFANSLLPSTTILSISAPGNVTALMAVTFDHFGITAPSSVTAGQSFGNVTVTAYDTSGNVFTGYAGSVYFISNDGQAILPYTSGNRYTFVSGDNGVHTFSGFTLKTTGSQTITVTDGTKSANCTITVKPGDLAKFTIATPSSTSIGVSFGGVNVTAYDAYGNVKTDYAGSVYFTASGSASLPYTLTRKYTFTSGDSGVHTFSGFTLNTSPSETITVTNGTISATSNPIIVNIISGEPYYSTSITPTSTSVSTNTNYTYTITNSIFNILDGTHVGYATIQIPSGFSGITVTSVTASTGSKWDWSVSGNTITVHADASSGELTITQDVVIVFSAKAPSSSGTYGPFTSTVYSSYNGGGSGPGTNTGTDPSVTVVGLLDHFVITAPSSAAKGTSFGGVTVTAYDASNNVVTSYTGSVYFTSTDTSATLPYTSTNKYTFTSGDNGAHTFSGFTLMTLGNQTITVTDGSKSATSGAITVSPGALNHFTITGYPASATAGTSFGSNNVTVTAYDAYGDVKTDYTGTVWFTSTDSAAALPYTRYSNSYRFTSGTGSDNGIHTFSGSSFILNTAGSQTITVTDGTYPATSNPITVNAGALAQFAFNTIGTVTRGTAFNVTITAEDAEGNKITSYNGAGTLSVSVSGDIITPSSITFSTGVWTSNSVTITGTATSLSAHITVVSGGIINNNTSNNFRIR